MPAPQLATKRSHVSRRLTANISEAIVFRRLQ
jgi:hypothetical protein